MHSKHTFGVSCLHSETPDCLHHLIADMLTAFLVVFNRVFLGCRQKEWAAYDPHCGVGFGEISTVHLKMIPVTKDGEGT